MSTSTSSSSRRGLLLPLPPALPVRRCAIHAANLRLARQGEGPCARCAALLILTRDRYGQSLAGSTATRGASNRSSSLPAWPVARAPSSYSHNYASPTTASTVRNMWTTGSFYARPSQSQTRSTEDFRRPLPGGETSVQQLVRVLHTTKTCYKRQPGFESRYGAHDIRERHNVDCDEVYPRIYIGDGQTATNKPYLKRIGITHVVNAAEGRGFGLVNTDSEYYRDALIKYIGFNMLDLPGTDISRFFESAAHFMKKAHDSGGRIYVHCMQGVSRSATLVIAYLMIDKGMLAADALHTVKLSRDVHPNEGFLRQLAELDNRLRRQRLNYKLPSL